MGLYTQDGIVFTAATTDWTRVLAINPYVDRITRNVLDRLKSRAVRIVGPLSSDGPITVVRCRAPEDRNPTTRFQVDAAGLPEQKDLKYRWAISGGDAVAQSPLDQPTFAATMPSSPAPVTVTVQVDDGIGYQGFGTLTFTPLSQQEYLQFQLWDHLRKLATLAQTPFRERIAGANEDTAHLVFPLWDPVTNRALTPSVRDLKEVVLGARQLTRFAEQLRELAEKLIEYEPGR